MSEEQPKTLPSKTLGPQWRVFNVSSKHPDKICVKLEKLLVNLETNGWHIKQVNGPFPMAIQEEAVKRVGVDSFENINMTTFTAFVVVHK